MCRIETNVNQLAILLCIVFIYFFLPTEQLPSSQLINSPEERNLLIVLHGFGGRKVLLGVISMSWKK